MELSLSPVFRRKWSSTYAALRDSRPPRRKLMKLYIEQMLSESRPLLAGDHTAWSRSYAVTLKDRTIEHQPTQIGEVLKNKIPEPSSHIVGNRNMVGGDNKGSGILLLREFLAGKIATPCRCTSVIASKREIISYCVWLYYTFPLSYWDTLENDVISGN